MTKQICLTFALAALTGCAFGVGVGNDLDSAPSDHVLVYSVVDVSGLPGKLMRSTFQTPEKTFYAGAVHDTDIDPSGKFAVIYATVRPNQSWYLSSIETMRTGIVASGRKEIYRLTPQQSPIRVDKSARKGGIVYAGASKWEFIQTPGVFAKNAFNTGRCPNCPSEKAVLKHLIAISKDANLNQNGYVDKLNARLKSLQ